MRAKTFFARRYFSGDIRARAHTLGINGTQFSKLTYSIVLEIAMSIAARTPSDLAALEMSIDHPGCCVVLPLVATTNNYVTTTNGQRRLVHEVQANNTRALRTMWAGSVLRELDIQ